MGNYEWGPAQCIIAIIHVYIPLCAQVKASHCPGIYAFLLDIMFEVVALIQYKKWNSELNVEKYMGWNMESIVYSILHGHTH